MSATGIAPVLFALAVILVAAKIGGELFERLRQPPVLGELLIGAVIGNLHYLGAGTFDALRDQPALQVLAQLGIILLLFEVGVESTVPEMLRVGTSSLLVAVIGVIAPTLLGIAVTRAFFPAASWYAAIFVATTLAATSVGITARVLRDLGKAQTAEARIILGAAVIDDVLGLMLLAAMVGAITAVARGGAWHAGFIALLVAKAVGFLVVAVALGRALAPRLFRAAARLRTPGILLSLSLVLCFVFAYVSTLAGLAPIVGAFTAGLVLEEGHLAELQGREQRSLVGLLRPVQSLFLPIFFFLMGFQMDVGALAHGSVVAFALALTLAAVAGKWASAVGVVHPGTNRLAIGIGMTPRGEVGLVFAGVGATLVVGGRPLLDPAVYASVLCTIFLTTVLTPPLLRRRLTAR